MSLAGRAAGWTKAICVAGSGWTNDSSRIVSYSKKLRRLWIAMAQAVVNDVPNADKVATITITPQVVQSQSPSLNPPYFEAFEAAI